VLAQLLLAEPLRGKRKPARPSKMRERRLMTTLKGPQQRRRTAQQAAAWRASRRPTRERPARESMVAAAPDRRAAVAG